MSESLEFPAEQIVRDVYDGRMRFAEPRARLAHRLEHKSLECQQKLTMTLSKGLGNCVGFLVRPWAKSMREVLYKLDFSLPAQSTSPPTAPV